MKIILMVLLTMISVAGFSQDTIVCGCPMDEHPSIIYMLPPAMSICACEPSKLVFGTNGNSDSLIIESEGTPNVGHIIIGRLTPTAIIHFNGIVEVSQPPLHFTLACELSEGSGLIYNKPQ